MLVDSTNSRVLIWGVSALSLKQHLKAYAPYPVHQVVSQELQAMCQSIIDFDVE